MNVESSLVKTIILELLSGAVQMKRKKNGNPKTSKFPKTFTDGLTFYLKDMKRDGNEQYTLKSKIIFSFHP